MCDCKFHQCILQVCWNSEVILTDGVYNGTYVLTQQSIVSSEPNTIEISYFFNNSLIHLLLLQV